MKNIHQLIVKNAKQAEKKIRKDGSMSPGHNGPYKDKETPVRNTSHWLITFSKAYKITKEKKYRLAVKKLADYLITISVRPHQASFHHRLSSKKDKCNGLIGQAWTIEALVEAGKVLKNSKYVKLATEVFLNHKFTAELGLWHRLEINGKTLSIDATLNHQIWFAASGTSLKNKAVQSQIRIFMNKLSSNMTILDNGLIFHPIVSVWQKQTFFFRMKTIIFGNYDKDKINEKLIYKSAGYHAFNMYSLAILKTNFFKHKFTYRSVDDDW